MPTIRFPTRIAHATDDEESARYALRGTLVTPEGFAFATNGRLAACVKAKVDGLAGPTMIPQELGPTSKADLKAEYHANGALKCEKHSVVKGQPRMEQANIREGLFPRVSDILHGIDARKSLVLAVNANYLWRLAQAINVPDTPAADVVILLIPKPDEGGVVTEAVGVLSNYDSLHDEDAGGFGIFMPCDADAAQARADFPKLRDTASASLDAAATSWSQNGVERAQRDEEVPAKPLEETKTAPAPAEQTSALKPRRRAARKRSVA
jgi:hypothetical protein